MKRLLLALLFLCGTALAQTAPVAGHCNLGGTFAAVSGLNSTNYLEGIIPGCTISVYNHGTQTLSTIYADSNNTPLSNPFTANSPSSPNSGGWIFWSADSACYDVVGSGGVAPITYPSPITLTEVCLGGGSSVAAIYQHNEVLVGQQPTLDVDDSATVIFSMTNDTGNNRVKISAATSGGGTVSSCGDLIPLFDCLVTGNNMGFTQESAPPNTLFGNLGNVYANPRFNNIPTCPNDGQHALVYPATSIQCETIALSGVSVQQGITDQGPVSGDQIEILRCPVTCTITVADCGTQAATSAVVDLKPTAQAVGSGSFSYGTLGSSILSAPMACVPGSATGTVVSGTLPANTPLMAVFGTVTGSVLNAYVTVTYTRSF